MEEWGNFSESYTSGNADLSPGEQIICIVLYVMLIILIVVGNGLLLFVIIKVKELKRSSRIFLVSLTVADLFVGLVAIPLRVVPQIIVFSISSTWIASDRLCEVSQFLEIFAISASVLAVLSLTIERYLAVEVPLRFRSLLTSRRAGYVVGCSWLASFCTALTLIITSVVYDGRFVVFDESSSRCVVDRLSGVPLFMFMDFIFVFFLLPLCVTVIASIRIMYIVKNHIAYQKQASNPSNCNCACKQTAGTSGTKSLPTLCNAVCRGLCKCFLHNKKALVTVLILTISYAASSVPFVVCMLYTKLSSHNVQRFLVELANISLFTSCFINVVVYTGRNRAFRGSAKRLLCILLPVKRSHVQRSQIKSKSEYMNASSSTQTTFL